MSLPEWTVSELQEKMKSSELTTRQLVVLYLEQIDLVNKSGPFVNSVTETIHISRSVGFVFGLPVGISFFAKAWQEPMLIRLAYAFEQATQFRRPPRFLPTANLSV